MLNLVLLRYSCSNREVKQDVDVGGVRVGEVNVLDERHLFENIFVFFALMQSAIDNRECERIRRVGRESWRHGVNGLLISRVI